MNLCGLQPNCGNNKMRKVSGISLKGMVIYTIAIGRLWDIQTKCWEYIYFKGLRPKIHLKQTAKTGMVEYTCHVLVSQP